MDLPRKYLGYSIDELRERIAQRKEQLGEELVILGHHYQRDEVIQFADFRGDSLKLSRQAAEQGAARYIVFCGVHFMAESADVLSAPEQIVCLPNLRAGCAMADMADAPAVETALEELSALSDEPIVPIAYVNSTAAIKAVTARWGGACCTSSNVRRVFEWALRPKDEGGAGAGKIFAVPDRHLAHNTAFEMGYDDPSCALYDPSLPDGGLSKEDVRRATFLLWKGHCYVHQVFRPEHVAQARDTYPGVQVIVHPECPREVVTLADQAGSTSQIITTIEAAPSGSTWAVGTEGNLVRRLDAQYPDKSIHLLGNAAAWCSQMAQIDLPHLLRTLDSITEGQPTHRITVSEDLAADARVSLQRMIEI